MMADPVKDSSFVGGNYNLLFLYKNIHRGTVRFGVVWPTWLVY